MGGRFFGGVVVGVRREVMVYCLLRFFCVFGEISARLYSLFLRVSLFPLLHCKTKSRGTIEKKEVY